jgi:hypothetical protein
MRRPRTSRGCHRGSTARRKRCRERPSTARLRSGRSWSRPTRSIPGDRPKGLVEILRSAYAVRMTGIAPLLLDGDGEAIEQPGETLDVLLLRGAQSILDRGLDRSGPVPPLVGQRRASGVRDSDQEAARIIRVAATFDESELFEVLDGDAHALVPDSPPPRELRDRRIALPVEEPESLGLRLRESISGGAGRPHEIADGATKMLGTRGRGWHAPKYTVCLYESGGSVLVRCDEAGLWRGAHRCSTR